jgi:hypothetical protein
MSIILTHLHGGLKQSLQQQWATVDPFHGALCYCLQVREISNKLSPAEPYRWTAEALLAMQEVGSKERPGCPMHATAALTVC